MYIQNSSSVCYNINLRTDITLLTKCEVVPSESGKESRILGDRVQILFLIPGALITCLISDAKFGEDP